MSKAKDHLPLITTMDCTYCSERSSAPGITVIDDETSPKKVQEMLGFMRMNGKEFNEEGLQTVAKTWKFIKMINVNKSSKYDHPGD